MSKSPFNMTEPFSVSFGILKLRYADYSDSIAFKNFLSPGDKVNVFINLESAYKHLSMTYQLDQKILTYSTSVDRIFIMNIMNLIAYYRRFFVEKGFDTKVYVYQTSFDSNEFAECRYNDFYRSYYYCKYNNNPKFAPFTEIMKETVIGEVSTYCDFIPGAYFIKAHNIEGSMVPKIIADSEPDRKNFIITGDPYDTQYELMDKDKFSVYYIDRSFSRSRIGCSVDHFVSIIADKPLDDIMQISSMYHTYPFYCSLLAVTGSRIRSLDGVEKIGPKLLCDNLKAGLATKLITEDTSSAELLGSIFNDEKQRDDFISCYHCSNILQNISLLTEAEKDSIIQQQVDRSDANTLMQICKTRFAEFPIDIECLLM